jgi:hypothetical protein
MRYIKTKLATNWPEKQSISEKIYRALLFFIPEANPDYKKKLHLIKEWLVEIDTDGLPFREIGLDIDGNVVVAGPDKRNYGFWCDTNMKIDDFEDKEIDKDIFLKYWDDYFNAESKN